MSPSAIAALRDLEKLAEELARRSNAAEARPTCDQLAEMAKRIQANVIRIKSAAKPQGGRR